MTKPDRRTMERIEDTPGTKPKSSTKMLPRDTDPQSSMPKPKSSVKKAHTSSMEKAEASINKGLKAAAKAGKLDNNPKFKAAVMGAKEDK